ncbi:hypothetical protein [Streptomyces sp. NBC_01618]|uniref:hypothetical protein n=1 Tax=Streptomyces sp. NBC_01618 TaxID=2975900 RepID=UPI00386F3D67|nr:hypothetical protein OH735_00040 [Streptomyces sp. NBC_01618]WTE38368.1 hypothetical protein OH735_38385 [Streptomyces sp. NBC_01618]
MSTYSPTQPAGDRPRQSDPGTVEAWETDGGACAGVETPRAPQTAPTAPRRAQTYIARCAVGASGYRTADGLALTVHRADTFGGPALCGAAPAWWEAVDPGQAMRRASCHWCLKIWTERTGLGRREQTADRMRWPVYRSERNYYGGLSSVHDGWVTQFDRIIGHRRWSFYHSSTAAGVRITAYPKDAYRERKELWFPAAPQPTPASA